MGFEHVQNANSGGSEVMLKSVNVKHCNQLSFSSFTDMSCYL